MAMKGCYLKFYVQERRRLLDAVPLLERLAERL